MNKMAGSSHYLSGSKHKVAGSKGYLPSEKEEVGMFYCPLLLSGTKSAVAFATGI